MNYRYSGPVSGLALPGQAEIVLSPGAIYALPPEDERVATLVALNHLVPIPDQAKPAKPAKGA